jgi:hypothetical protein
MFEIFGGAFGLVMLICFALVIFIAFREIACWYFKTTDIVRLLTEIRDSIRKSPGTTRQKERHEQNVPL